MKSKAALGTAIANRANSFASIINSIDTIAKLSGKTYNTKDFYRKLLMISNMFGLSTMYTKQENLSL